MQTYSKSSFQWNSNFSENIKNGLLESVETHLTEILPDEEVQKVLVKDHEESSFSPSSDFEDLLESEGIFSN